jgi:hypothetical protein
MSAPQVESFKAPLADEKVESWEEKVESWNESYWRKSRFLEFFGWILLDPRNPGVFLLNSPYPPCERTSEAGPPNTKKISATPENIEDHGAHPPNFGDATT